MYQMQKQFLYYLCGYEMKNLSITRCDLVELLSWNMENMKIDFDIALVV